MKDANSWRVFGRNASKLCVDKNTRAGGNTLIQFVSLVGKKVNFKLLQKYGLFGLQSVDEYVNRCAIKRATPIVL